MSIPTPHIKAKPEDFAPTVLMPGDPLRSKFIAETFLEDAVLVNNVRGVQGYTGNYKGKKVITKTLEALLNYFCSEGYDKLQEVFYAEGFVMTALSVGSLVVNAPMYSDIGVWQSGGTRVTFKLTQLKEE